MNDITFKDIIRQLRKDRNNYNYDFYSASSSRRSKVLVDATLFVLSEQNIPEKLVKIGACTAAGCVLLENLRSMSILQEMFEKGIIDEDETVDELYVLQGITVQVADEINGNGRIYPYNVLKKAVEQAQSVVKSRQMIGELDHISSELNPENPYPLVSRASHLILNLWMEGKEVKTDILILPTVYGKHLLQMLKAGVTVGISLRGLGDFDSNGNVKDLTILTYDFVSYPSYSKLLIDKSMLKKVKLS